MDGGYSSPTAQRNKKGSGIESTPSRNAITTNGKNHRHTVVDEDDCGDPIECSGKSCKACTGGLIADCVAVCCCPCAVVNILALAFLKIPWMVGKKCLRMAKKKKLEKKRKDDKSCCYSADRVMYADSVEREEGGGEVGTLGMVNSQFGEEELKDSFSARIDAEEVWLELYRVGHMGFGRVSFTGINSSQGKAN
ncbi:uncharacterized protein [Nicotiana tomentosiformis]|uniref:uncharacterized protein n=1 Tax=Nicotiana tomentosiformis TaxID=4098 RepID=UPI00051AFC85|nr:uncharacterized protein LOC104094233 [Nicotiana tomentosiformis]XP_018625626.1 uncharacterized protein LOC104094233 [Nicotiana tomentosiformis]